MVEQEDPTLTAILKAAADPTRRAILTLVAQHGPQRVTDLAGRFELSLNAISKHIKVLEAAGLVSRRTDWREHRIALEPQALNRIDQWFGQLRSIWALRLDALDKALTETSTLQQGETDDRHDPE